ALVRANGKIVAANELFLGIGAPVSLGRDDRLRLSSRKAAVLLDAALRSLGGADRRRPPHSIAVPAVGDEVPVVLHVLPAERSARDLFASAVALLLVTRVEAPTPPSTRLLQALFDLTPAEARIA